MTYYLHLQAISEMQLIVRVLTSRMENYVQYVNKKQVFLLF